MTIEETIKELKDASYCEVRYGDKDNHYDKVMKRVEAFEMAIKALEQTRWIPVNEELPEESEYYLITGTYNNNKYVDIAYYYKQSKLWDSVYDEYEKHYDANTAIAWKPLPEPYTESEE